MYDTLIFGLAAADRIYRSGILRVVVAYVIHVAELPRYDLFCHEQEKRPARRTAFPVCGRYANYDIGQVFGLMPTARRQVD